MILPALTLLASLPGALPTASVESLSRLDLLPTFRTGVKVGAVTSYDRTEGNDDGFSGKYSFVRKEGDALVLADLKGPGCITRFHTPTPTDETLEFYFDGEATPRVALPYRDLFSGRIAPFVRPLVDAAGGGNYSYVPMPYSKSCKVVLRAPSTQFYDINFATYPAGTAVTTFDPKAVSAASLDRAKRLFEGGCDRDLTDLNVPAGAKLARHPVSARIAPGGSATLFESKRGGRIASLRLGPSAVFEGKARDLLLRITWDGEKSPSIEMPAGDFFGYAWGKPAMGSALVGTAGYTNYCNLPMPYDRAAKIELVSRRSGAPVEVKGEIVVADAPRRPDEGRFYAVWHRENPTTEGRPFTWLDMRGRGHLVGLALQAQGIESGNTFFFEGDDITTIDGGMAVHGTGSEDFFNGGWYDVPGRWDGPFARALSGCMAYQRYLGRTGAYRFLLGDAYSFERSLTQTIEHAPTGNRHPADYAGVAYLYAAEPPAREPLGELAVRDPERLIYSAHWTMPIDGFSLAGTTLTRGDIPVGKGRERVLSLRAKGEGDFDLCFVTLRAEIPAAGRYRVSLDAVRGPEGGRVRMYREDVPLGPEIDLYAPEATRASGLPAGEFEATEGGNALMFKVFPRDGSSVRGMDLVNVVCERVR